MTRTLRKVSAVLVVLMVCSPGFTQEDLGGREDLPILQGVNLMDRADEDDRISILVEEGAIAPPQNLLNLTSSAEVSLRIDHGPARFLSPLDGDDEFESLERFDYIGTTIRLPALSVGKAGQDSVLLIFVDGQALGAPFRIGTLDPEAIDRLWLEMLSTAPAILRVNQDLRYGILDPTRVDWTQLERDAENLERKKEHYIS